MAHCSIYSHFTLVDPQSGMAAEYYIDGRRYYKKATEGQAFLMTGGQPQQISKAQYALALLMLHEKELG